MFFIIIISVVQENCLDNIIITFGDEDQRLSPAPLHSLFRSGVYVERLNYYFIANEVATVITVIRAPQKNNYS